MDELLGNRIPHSPEAETSVIGAILIEPECTAEVLQRVKAEHFYVQPNREMYETIVEMFTHGMPIDPVTLLEQMTKRGVFNENTRRTVAETIRMTPTAANVGEYINILIEKATQRTLANVAEKLTEMVNKSTDADTMLAELENTLLQLRTERGANGMHSLAEVVQQVYQNIATISEQGGRIPGTTTGLIDLDRQILGLNPGELILIASRPGMGKTSIALNIALAAGRASGKTVAIFSLEMGREQLVTRMLSAESMVPAQKILQGRLDADDWRRLIEGAEKLSAVDMQINDNPLLSVADMSAQCRCMKNLGLVVVDYLQLMQTKAETRQQAVADISRMFKIMSKELNIPVICLSQLSRAAEARSDKRPLLSDLRESGAIEQDADIVIALYREEYYNKECENPGSAEAIILKNRKGKTGTIPLVWLGEYTTYTSADEVHRGDEEYEF